MGKQVTVYFFKGTGKWYTTEEFEWAEESQDAMNRGDWRRAIACMLPKERLGGMYAVAINSPLGFPVMVMNQ